MIIRTPTFCYPHTLHTGTHKLLSVLVSCANTIATRRVIYIRLDVTFSKLEGEYYRISLNACSTLICHLSRRPQITTKSDWLYKLVYLQLQLARFCIYHRDKCGIKAMADYEVWTGYRVSSGRLNLFHTGGTEDKSSKTLPSCRGCEETISHLFWECQSAAALWDKLVALWTGEQVSRQHTQQF